MFDCRRFQSESHYELGETKSNTGTHHSARVGGREEKIGSVSAEMTLGFFSISSFHPLRTTSLQDAYLREDPAGRSASKGKRT
jgi:hypothetical protein